jgi:hypothetical protein
MFLWSLELFFFFQHNFKHPTGFKGSILSKMTFLTISNSWAYQRTQKTIFLVWFLWIYELIPGDRREKEVNLLCWDLTSSFEKPTSECKLDSLFPSVFFVGSSLLLPQLQRKKKL